MIKRLITLILISLLVTSCYKYKEPKKPENLISKRDMANILIDLRLIRSANGNNKKVLDSHYVKASSYIYKKYNVDSLQFTLSNDYYAYFIEDYDEIYTRVKDSLTKLKEEYKSQSNAIAKAKKVADSIKKVERKAKLEKEKAQDSVIIKPVSSK